MTINLRMPDLQELKPHITVFGVGGAGCNAVNNMIEAGLEGVDFVVANTDAQALAMAKAERLIQMGVAVTEGLGAGSQPEIGRAAAEETIDEINDHLSGAHMVFITAGMGGGTGTGAAPVVARAAREAGILTVGVVTKPFQFEGVRRMRLAEAGIEELTKHVDTLIVIPNQNLFRIANEKTTFADAFAMADEVLYSGVACITDLMVKEGLINLDFADVRSVMREMGRAMMGTGQASGEKRAVEAAEKAISNPLLDDISMKGAQGLLISITGGRDMTLFEVDEAASRVREEVDGDANIIFGATFDESLEGMIRVSVVATGIDHAQRMQEQAQPAGEAGIAELQRRLRSVATPAQPAREREIAHAQALDSLEAELASANLRAAPAAIQPARAPASQRQADPSVRIGPFRPEPSLATPRAMEADFEGAVEAETSHPGAQPFIPPAAERPEDVQPRMPRVEDFPAVAQRGARPQQVAHAVEDERRPRGLLARITHGLAKREEEVDYPRQPAQRPSMEIDPRAAHAAAPPAPRQSQSEFAKQAQPRRMGEPAPVAGNLDPRGRVVQPETRREDDHLEIPAFLRRQSS
ncbi:cell division protein FtsZ [Propylenella binzhouense]|uniref:Cell division protein FtsZ n=1 Tax=Propylenella binzhouense TaxID=2555902 RepID=A0A964T2A4_9HYPH|nr:cell division protein FtsZ [Propylenella binzhouense]MYZ46945.1 cell division protein FtsZ [Propylenella binzhouense]